MSDQEKMSWQNFSFKNFHDGMFSLKEGEKGQR